jgi:non-heme chloroperoxidase
MRRKLVATVLLIPLACILALAAMLVFGTAEPPSEMASVTRTAKTIDRSDLPPLSHYTARDGAELAFRAHPAGVGRVAVLVHGSVEGGAVMHAVAKTCQAEGVTVYALDMRGHGESGRRGDIDYIGQLDDDLADFIAAAVRPDHPDAIRVLVGFSSGGGFASRIAGGQYGELFNQYVLLSPVLAPGAPTLRPNSGGWVRVNLGRAIALTLLDRIGLHWFESLPLVVFAVSPSASGLTPAYSYRLALSFGAERDYLASFRRARRPMMLLVGSEDEINIADRYAPLLKPVKQDLQITVLPGVGHMGLITDPQALRVIATAVASPR